jgi:hypothetical protein
MGESKADMNRKPIKKVLYLFLFLSLFDLALRLILTAYGGASVLRPKEIIYHYYPMTRDIKEQYAHTDTHSYKILVLSCSTLQKDWGDIKIQLEKRLNISDKMASPGADSFSVFNASGIGFSSRDNLTCYRLLSDLRFDLVIDYSGINDARFNNCPGGIFKNDYSQIPWNNEINCILRHPEMNYTVIPFFIDFSYQLIYESIAKDKFIPVHYSMRQSWWDFGSDLKSLKAFKSNIEGIQALSKEKKEQLLFVSYCYYIPSDYTLKKFKCKRLDYTYQKNSREIEIWGWPKNISSFLDSADIVVKRIATDNNVPYLNIRPEFEGKSLYFADICHFSPAGLTSFSDLVSREILSLKQRQS